MSCVPCRPVQRSRTATSIRRRRAVNNNRPPTSRVFSPGRAVEQRGLPAGPSSRPASPDDCAAAAGFDQAQEVADRFKEGQPVIMNIEGTDREIARRLIDFAERSVLRADGSMEKVATGVYLLKPSSSRSGRHDEYDD